MIPTEAEQFEAMRIQIHQSLVEHDILAQALRAQSLISAGFVLVLGLALIWLLRRNYQLSTGLIELQRQHFAESIEREKRHSTEWIELQRQHGLELDSITRQSWREFVDAVLKKPGA